MSLILQEHYLLQPLHVSNASRMHLPLRLHGCKLLPYVTDYVIALHVIHRLCFPLAGCAAATHDIDEVEVVRGTGREVGSRCVHRGQLLKRPGFGLEVISKG